MANSSLRATEEAPMGDARAHERMHITEIVLAGGGDMGARMRAHDWSQTSLCPVEDWPQSLRTAISICLHSRFPILIWWGSELAMLYNDAYRPMLGATKHPQALGAPGRAIWPEIWDIIGPMLDGVLEAGIATYSEDILLLLERHGYSEECYFTFSYSPLRDEIGDVGGVFCAVTETTGRVLGERRLRTLRDLADHTIAAKTEAEACARALDVLADNRADLPFTALYLLDATQTQARLMGATGLAPGSPAAPAQVELTDPLFDVTAAWPLTEVVRTGASTRLDDLSARFGALPSGLWNVPPHTGVVL